MSSTALKISPASSPVVPQDPDPHLLASDSSYEVRIATGGSEIAAALRLRHDVFNREMGVASTSDEAMDRDQFDLRCKHLIAIERSTGRIIGTYRLNTIGDNEGIEKFYSHVEFTLETLPEPVLRNGVEIGRACVAAEHRNTRALFLLWKGLARYITSASKRYIFGCCSIFTDDAGVGDSAYRQLIQDGHVSSDLFVTPRMGTPTSGAKSDDVALPPLFDMYLKMGAKVCGPATYDAAFGTVDFLVVLDLAELNDRYRRMFLG